MNTTRREALLTIGLATGALATGIPGRALAADAPADVLASKYPFVLPPLPYNVDAMEPFIDARTMEIHHDKHHAAYVTNLNAAMEKAPDEVKAMTLGQLLTNLSKLPENLQAPVRNNGGGHANHSFFWNILKKEAPTPRGVFGDAFETAFGGMDGFKEKWDAAAKGVFGSGWAWMIKDGNGKLTIVTTPNQDTPISSGVTPLLGIDVWEHAYYLKYQNRRPDYITAFYNVIHWEAVASRFGETAKVA